MIVYGGEGLLILAGNCVATFIFFKIRNTLKRTSYLLINLTVADLLLGIAISLYIWEGIALMESKNISVNVGRTAIMIDLLASTASLLSLSLISLERMFAILWPFRHWLLEMWYYFASISVVWVLATANAVYIHVVTTYLVDSGALNYVTIPMFSIAILSILTTIASYLAIWMATRRNQLQNSTSRSLAQNRKLAKTLFIVTILSLITWLPAGISLASPSYLMDTNSLHVDITVALQYANSFLNPIVYSFRMAEFKKSLKKLFCRCYSRKPIRDDIPVWVSQDISLTHFKTIDWVLLSLHGTNFGCLTVSGKQEQRHSIKSRHDRTSTRLSYDFPPVFLHSFKTRLIRPT